MKNILFAASEGVPFIKTGGLADVIGSLPKYLNKDEFDVRVILPKYTCIKEELKASMKYITHFYMDLNWRRQYVGIFESEYEGIKYYFIDNEFYFQGFAPYGNIYEDIEKFAFFCRAVLSALPVIGFKPQIIHCHDWQTGLIPVFLHDSFQSNEFYWGIKTIMTIHNLKFQGIWDKKVVKEITGLSDYYFTPDKLEYKGDSNYLKGGIVYADYVTTVSTTYAEEIKMPFYGEGLDGLMRARSNCLCGIVNGLDYDDYNPDTDPLIVNNFNVMNYRVEKVKNKLALQKELGLEENPDKFMIGICSRLTDQKGLDLVDYVIEEICAEDTQFVVLGTGDPKYENLFRHFAWKYPDRVSANIYYSNERSHRIYASADAYLMPSLFEPCGLSQLMALHYGTLPIVRETGGLKDTVEPFNQYTGEGNGFTFDRYESGLLLDATNRAKTIYFEYREAWDEIVKRNMNKDVSWEVSAKQYRQLYVEMTQ